MSKEGRPGNSGEIDYTPINPFLHHRGVLSAQRKCEVGIPVGIDFQLDEQKFSEEVRRHSFWATPVTQINNPHSGYTGNIVGAANPDGYIAYASWLHPLLDPAEAEDFPDGMDVETVLYAAVPKPNQPSPTCLARVTETSGKDTASSIERQYAFWDNGSVSLLTCLYVSGQENVFTVTVLDEQQALTVTNAIEGAIVIPYQPPTPPSSTPPTPPGAAS